MLNRMLRCLVSGVVLAGVASALIVIQSSAPGAAQEVLRRVPQAVEPEPFGTPRTKTGGSQINFPIDPQTLPQNLSKVLSTACERLAFNQVRQGKYYVIVAMPDGPPKRFGYATGKGLNLLDPENLRGEDLVYLFRDDGTSECRVYAYPTVF